MTRLTILPPTQRFPQNKNTYYYNNVINVCTQKWSQVSRCIIVLLINASGCSEWFTGSKRSRQDTAVWHSKQHCHRLFVNAHTFIVVSLLIVVLYGIQYSLRKNLNNSYEKITRVYITDAVVTCEIKIFRNNFEFTSVLYFTSNYCRRLHVK